MTIVARNDEAAGDRLERFENITVPTAKLLGLGADDAIDFTLADAVPKNLPVLAARG